MVKVSEKSVEKVTAVIMKGVVCVLIGMLWLGGAVHVRAEAINPLYVTKVGDSNVVTSWEDGSITYECVDTEATSSVRWRTIGFSVETRRYHGKPKILPGAKNVLKLGSSCGMQDGYFKKER